MAARTLSFGYIALLLVASAPAFVLQSASLLASARAKLARIESGKVPPGGSVTLTASELAAYSTEQAEIMAPGAVRNISLHIAPGTALATASVNFLKIRQAQGHAGSWLMRQLFDGEREVRVSVRIQSANGRARVDVDRVEVSGIVMDGKALEFLLSQFVLPNFPQARVSRSFELSHNMDHFQLKSGGVVVVMQK